MWVPSPSDLGDIEYRLMSRHEMEHVSYVRKSNPALAMNIYIYLDQANLACLEQILKLNNPVEICKYVRRSKGPQVLEGRECGHKLLGRDRSAELSWKAAECFGMKRLA